MKSRICKALLRDIVNLFQNRQPILSKFLDAGLAVSVSFGQTELQNTSSATQLTLIVTRQTEYLRVGRIVDLQNGAISSRFGQVPGGIIASLVRRLGVITGTSLAIGLAMPTSIWPRRAVGKGTIPGWSGVAGGQASSPQGSPGRMGRWTDHFNLGYGRFSC